MMDQVPPLEQLSPEARRSLLTEMLRDGARRPKIRPASFAQERLWFLEQLAPDTPFFNIDVAIEIHAQLSPAIVEKSLNEIIRRHEVLRTTFVASDGQPVQVIAPALTLSVPVVDLSSRPEPERRAQAIQLASDEARRPFDIARGPLLRATLLRLEPTEFVLLVTMHHIISDGWSIGLLFGELSTLYAAYAAGRPSPLEALPVQYADYAAWQREWLQGETLKGQLTYWRRQLANVSTLELPTDRARPASPTHQGGYHSVVLSPALSEKLRALSHQKGVTLFMTLLAAFAALLHRYTCQSDLVVGTYVANRNRSEIEQLIGFFINTLVMRIDASGDPTFEELVSRVRETAVDAYAHQDMPFTMVVEALQPERDLARNPLFQVVFQLVADSTPAAGHAGSNPTSTTALSLPWRRAAALDLVFSLADAPSGLAGGIEYSTELFDADTIARMAGHFQLLLTAIVERPGDRISQLPLLSAVERRQLLVDWNDTSRSFPLDAQVMTLFEQVVTRRPDAVAFECNGEVLTYAQLDRRSSQVARYLTSVGVGRERLVGLALARSLDAVIGVLGILKAGGACLPLDPGYPRERLAFIIDDAKPHAILTDARHRVILPPLAIPVLQLDDQAAEIAAMPSDSYAVDVAPEDLAYVIYTSGSTGGPKGAGINYRQILNRLNWMWTSYPFEDDDIGCQKTALNFIDSIWQLVGPLLRGRPTVIVPDEAAKDPGALVSLLARHNVTRLWVVPSLLSSLLETYPDLGVRLPALRFWVSSGEALRPELIRRFRVALPHARLYNLYGTSEVWDVTWYDTACDDPLRPRVGIGTPIANVRVRVLDSYGQLVPIGVPGELHVGGAAVGPGYLTRPELTQARFIPDPFQEGELLYRSGDRARYRGDGVLELIDRIDRQVKIRGHRVETDEVEALLAGWPGVRQSAVVPREVSPGDIRLVAYVAADDDPDVNAWRVHLRRHLPEYMVPWRFLRLETLPLTPSGKVDRLALATAYSGRVQTNVASNDRPRTPTESVIGELCAEVFDVSQVGIHDDFFADLGGHSLLATRLISRIRDRFGAELPLRRVFEEPTVAGIARALASVEEQTTLQEPTIRRVPRHRQQVQISPTGVLEQATAPLGTPSES